ncbi:hypothetical protein RAM80_28295 [Pseudomonas sp. App30]|uniref:hypothetical protein n=1 Tax=Pseudomonas sp. App30 TaxID=3068990 RepID=UPI003A7F7425
MNNQRGTRKAGDLDTRFGDQGWINMNHLPSLSAIVTTRVSPDGALVVLTHNAQLPGYQVSKFLPDGTLDPTFGTGGVKEDVHPSGRPRVSLELAEDKILVFAAHEGSLMLARYDDHGQPDQAFGPDGKVFVALDDVLSREKDDVVVSFAPLAEHALEERTGEKIPNYSGGGIVTAGIDNRWFVAFSARFTDARLPLSVLLCLTSEGAVELSFNRSGYVVIDLAGEERNMNFPLQLQVQRNGENRGKPLLTVDRNLIGSPPVNSILVRRLSSGEPDYDFGPKGSPLLPINRNELSDYPYLILGADDDFKLAGLNAGGEQSLATVRAYNADGKTDPTFNNGELWVSPSHPAGSRWVSGVATGAGENFRLVVSGVTNDEAEVRIGRVDGAAQPDPAFGEGGISRFANRPPSTLLSGAKGVSEILCSGIT